MRIGPADSGKSTLLKALGAVIATLHNMVRSFQIAVIVTHDEKIIPTFGRI